MCALLVNLCCIIREGRAREIKKIRYKKEEREEREDMRRIAAEKKNKREEDREEKRRKEERMGEVYPFEVVYTKIKIQIIIR